MEAERASLPRIGLEYQSGASSRATGIGQYARALLEAMSTACPEVDLRPLVPSDPDGTRWTTPRRVLWDQIGAPRAARRASAAILHTPGFAPSGRRSCVRVHTLHDLIGMERPDLVRGRAARWYWGRHLPRRVRSCDHIITSSEYTARLARHFLHIPAHRLTVVPLAPVARPAVERRVPLPGWPARYVLSLGSLEPRKDHVLLVRAFARLPASLRDAVGLVIAGSDGGDRGRIEATCRECGVADRVLLPGYLSEEDVAPALAAAEIFAFPSRAEGFGLPPLEAMGAGVPVVALAAGAVPEVVGHGALLVAEPYAIEELAAALRTLLDSQAERETWIAAGTRRVARYSWARTAELTAAVYQEAWRSRRGVS